MKESTALRKRRHAPRAGAALLLAALAVGVAACGAQQPVGADERPSQAAKKTSERTTSSPAAVKRPQGTSVALTYAMRTYYLPPSAKPSLETGPASFQVRLEPRGWTGTRRSVAKDVKVTFDLSAFKGLAKVRWINQGNRHPDTCVRAGDQLTCALGDLEEYGATFEPFALDVLPDAPKGPAGALHMEVTSANAPTVQHTTRLVVGTPRLTLRQEKERAGVRQGSELPLTPAFGNQGDTAIDDDLVVTVEAKAATLRPQYRNCRYDKLVAPTKAECTFPGPLPAGTAYETDKPLTAVAGGDAMQGVLDYHVYRAHDRRDALYPQAQLPESAPSGTGAPLGLHPVDGSGDDFAPSAYEKADAANGTLAFATDQTHDVQAVGFTIKGKVGQSLMVSVPLPRNLSERTFRVTLPEGVSMAEFDRSGYASEMSFCGSVDGVAECAPAMTGDAPSMFVRIDKRVDGAQGTVTATSDPKVDANQENNTAPVKVEYVD
ncbi:hypothetical protein ACIQU6_38700 [Streptomyces sp. NPDC090442]|uniref:hypothetical protein n=1 Tax=Streptomyces sp. NPDC090442 TaxID=3365962 RepID=UPI00380B5F8A